MKKILLSLTLGIVASASLPHAGWLGFVYDITPYSFASFAISVGGLFTLITTFPITRGAVFARTFAWSFGYFLFGLNWVGNALLIPGNDFVWAWLFAFIGLPFLLSFFLGTVFTLFFSLLIRTPERLKLPLFATLFTGAEFLRGHLFTGFPWILPAMFWSETLPVFQSIATIGIYGLTFFTILWAGTLGLICLRKTPVFSFPVFISLLTASLMIFISAPPPENSKTPVRKVQIVMVQANIPQSEKWNGEKMADHFYTHLDLSAYGPDITPDLPAMIVWPETTLPPSFLRSPHVSTMIKGLLSHYPPESILITGALRDDRTPEGPVYYNSVVAYDRNNGPQIVYDKHHLVPFGEYIPFQKHIPIGPIAGFDGLKAGTGPVTVTLPNLPSFSPLVCYEILFSKQIVAYDKNTPQLIINVTNDGWYGNSPGPYQHLMEARARAIEEKIPVVRVAGTGISAIYNGTGELVNWLTYNHKGRSVMILSFR